MSHTTSGLLDTSVLIDHGDIALDDLPEESFVPAVVLAELAAGPHAAATLVERAQRQARLQWVEASFVSIPFDAATARAYGMIFAAANAAGQKTKRRQIDYMIAATAYASGLPLYTKNPRDFGAVNGLVQIIALPTRH